MDGWMDGSIQWARLLGPLILTRETDLASELEKRFDLKRVRLSVDGFMLLRSEPIQIIRESDLIRCARCAEACFIRSVQAVRSLT
jgi:hypothetical protein